MMPLVFTGLLLLGLPLALFIVFKSNAAVMFFAACAGVVLLTTLDPTVVATAASVVPGEGEAYIRLAVVVASVAFAALLLRGSVHKPAEYMLHGLLVIVLAATLWAIMPELTNISWLEESTRQSTWEYVDDFKALVVAVGLSLSLLLLLKSRGGEKAKGKH